VGQVAAVRQGQAEDGVAGLQEGQIDGKVGRRAGVGLDVGVLGPEERFRPVDGEFLDFVDPLLAFVIPFAGVAFRVLVGEDTAAGFKHGAARVVFGSDQADFVPLPRFFLPDEVADFRIKCVEIGHDDPLVARGRTQKSPDRFLGGKTAQARGYSAF
jgi:hypothetical protein